MKCVMVCRPVVDKFIDLRPLKIQLLFKSYGDRRSPKTHHFAALNLLAVDSLRESSLSLPWTGRGPGRGVMPFGSTIKITCTFTLYFYTLLPSIKVYLNLFWCVILEVVTLDVESVKDYFTFILCKTEMYMKT